MTPPRCFCHDCNLPYSDPGFHDLIVPNDVWKQIAPREDGSGLLCPTCLVRRASVAGIFASATFTSGPFSNSDLGEITSLRSENERLRAALMAADTWLDELHPHLDSDRIRLGTDWEEVVRQNNSVSHRIRAALSTEASNG